MNKVDWNAVNRRIVFVEQEMAHTRRWIADAEAERYSPLMSSEVFEQQFANAIAATGMNAKAVCIFEIPRPHRCSRCEALVEAFMSKRLVHMNG